MNILKLPAPPPVDNPPCGWLEHYIAALQRYGDARDAHREAVQGSAGLPARLATELEESVALNRVEVVCEDAAADHLFGLRQAAKLQPESLRDLLLSVLAKPIAEALDNAATPRGGRA
jgi:hypothetical protein